MAISNLGSCFEWHLRRPVEEATTTTTTTKELKPDLIHCSVFENHIKKSHSTWRAKRATFTFWVEMPKMVYLASFWKPEACGQIVLPDRSVLKEQQFLNATCWIIFKHCAVFENWEFENAKSWFLIQFEVLIVLVNLANSLANNIWL